MGSLNARQAGSEFGDDRTIEDALKAAHIPTLAAALMHLTGDAGLLSSIHRPAYVFLGDKQGGIPEAEQAQLRALALEALKAYRDGRPLPAPPPAAAVREAMNFVAGAEIPEHYVPFLMEQLNLGGDGPRAKPPEIEVPDAAKQRFRVLVIGAGMSGILAAIELQQAGIPFVVVEKNADFGGTWYENSYPGCRVDSQNHLYSYSSEPNHDWPQYFSDRNVLYAYFRRVAAKHGLARHVRFETAVEAAVYDERRQRWSVTIRDRQGRTETLEANAVISAVGQLNQPRLPDIEGRDDFQGPSFHSARWDHEVALAGKRVAVIGTGASAFQFVPEIAPQVGQLHVFQRSAPWLAPTPEYHDNVPAGMQWLLRHMPFYETWYRFYLFWITTDGIYQAVKIDPAWTGPDHAVSGLNDQLRRLLTAHIASQTGGDPELLAKVVPTYPPGGKRMLRDNGTWIAALRRPNVEVVADPIERITPTGIRLRNGRQIDVDAIIYGTGFKASDFLGTFTVKGRGGADLHEHWAGDARAYLGMTVPGFPNFFCVYGPNTNIVVNGSIIFFSECAIRYILGCIKLMLEGGHGAIECREEVHAAFNETIDRENAGMAWGAPQVTSWYKNSKGRVSQNWPLPLVDYWTATRQPNPADFRLEAAAG